MPAIPLRLRFGDLGAYNRYIDRARMRLAVAAKRRLEYWADRARTEIRRDRTLFHYAQQPIDDGRGQRRRKGALKASLWVGRAKRSSGKSLSVEMGWGVPYGPVLEWGPRVRQWIIRPRGFRVAKRGGVAGVKSLRFRVGNEIVYARKVVHTWSRDQLRPHWTPTLDALEPQILDDLGKVAEDVIEHGR